MWHSCGNDKQPYTPESELRGKYCLIPALSGVKEHVCIQNIVFVGARSCESVSLVRMRKTTPYEHLSQIHRPSAGLLSCCKREIPPVRHADSDSSNGSRHPCLMSPPWQCAMPPMAGGWVGILPLFYHYSLIFTILKENYKEII